MDAKEFPYLMKCSITAIIVNKASLEERVTFEAVFPLTHAAVEMPWYVLHNHLAPAFLTKKLGIKGVGWKRIYECKIVKVINRENPADITNIPMRVMTTEQLMAYVVRWGLAVDVAEFHSLDTARQFVQLMEEDPSAYPKHIEEYREARKKEYPEVDRYRKDAALMVEDLADEFETLETEPLGDDPVSNVKPTPKKPRMKKGGGRPVKAKPVAAAESLSAVPAEGMAIDPKNDPFNGV